LSVTERSEELDKVLDVFAPGFDEKQWTKSSEKQFNTGVKYLRRTRASTTPSFKFVGS